MIRRHQLTRSELDEWLRMALFPDDEPTVIIDYYIRFVRITEAMCLINVGVYMEGDASMKALVS